MNRIILIALALALATLPATAKPVPKPNEYRLEDFCYDKGVPVTINAIPSTAVVKLGTDFYAINDEVDAFSPVDLCSNLERTTMPNTRAYRALAVVPATAWTSQPPPPEPEYSNWLHWYNLCRVGRFGAKTHEAVCIKRDQAALALQSLGWGSGSFEQPSALSEIPDPMEIIGGSKRADKVLPCPWFADTPGYTDNQGQLHVCGSPEQPAQSPE